MDRSKKKYGLLTFHYATNYGGIWQCVALYRHLTELGCNIEVVDYVPAGFNPRSLGLGVRTIIHTAGLDEKINYIRRAAIKKEYCGLCYEKCRSFCQNNLRLSRRVDEQTLEPLLAEYDAIVVGSDQIWNPAQRSKNAYFLNYGSYLGKRIAYAADSNNARIAPEEVKVLSRALHRFDAISVRNRHSQSFVEKLTGTTPPIVADPTLFIPSESSSPINKPYIFSYVLGREIKGGHSTAIEKIRRVYGNIPVKAAVVPQTTFDLSGYADQVFYDLDPAQWADLIRSAALLYTDSFHGVLFAIKYRVPFVAYYADEKRAARLLELKTDLKLGDRIVSSVADISDSLLNEAIDYDRIESIQHEMVTQSELYLQKALMVCEQGSMK